MNERTVGQLLDELRAMDGGEHLCVVYRGTYADKEWKPGPWNVESTGAHVSIQVASGPPEAEALTAAILWLEELNAKVRGGAA